MKIAIPYDFEVENNIKREGIGVYLNYLIFALVHNNKDIDIEIYTYDFNVNNVKLLLDNIPDDLKNKIKIIDNNYWNISDIFLYPFVFIKNIINIIFLIISVSYYLMNTKIFKSSKYIQKIEKKQKKLLSKWKSLFVKNHLLYQKIKTKKKKLIAKITKSNANAVYCFYVSIKLGHYFKCKKIVQVHDLFTMALPELFKTQILNLEKTNEIYKQNLGLYAKEGAIFVSSSEYVSKSHCLRYIPNIKEEQTRVIPFPPMISSFKEVKTSKNIFLDKYNIKYPYIAFPSQNRPNKNWELIFKALKILKDKGLNIQFVTTGKVKDIKSNANLVDMLGIKDLILEIGSISTEDLYLLYKYSSICVASNIIEGMGISGQALEALNVGNIPVIHVKSLGIEESLANVGLTLKTADLNWIEINDYVGLANKIEEVMNSPELNVIKQKHIIEAYNKITWNMVAQNYFKLFEE